MTRDHRCGHLSTNDVTMTSPDDNNNSMTAQHTWDIADNVFPIVSDTAYFVRRVVLITAINLKLRRLQNTGNSTCGNM